jgi:hypothetical protein
MNAKTEEIRIQKKKKKKKKNHPLKKNLPTNKPKKKQKTNKKKKKKKKKKNLALKSHFRIMNYLKIPLIDSNKEAWAGALYANRITTYSAPFSGRIWNRIGSSLRAIVNTFNWILKLRNGKRNTRTSNRKTDKS